MVEKGKGNIVSMMEESRVFEPSEEIKKQAYLSMEDYKKLYRKSIDKPDEFWSEMADQLEWFKKWEKVCEWDFHKPELKWFVGGKLNVSYNCLDKHIK